MVSGLLLIVYNSIRQSVELIGEEIYDEFDPEGESRLKSYTVPKPKVKSKNSRGREPAVQSSPVAPSEGTTVIGVEEVIGEATPKSNSQPTSPDLSASHEDGPISRTSSLGQSLSALAMHRKIRASNASASPPPSQAGWRTPRERSQQRKSKSEGEPGNVGLAPLSGAPERISDVQEEPERIPDAQEKSGPDIWERNKDEAKDE